MACAKARHFFAAPENGGGDGLMSMWLTVWPEQTNIARARCAPAVAEQASSNTIEDRVERMGIRTMSLVEAGDEPARLVIEPTVLGDLRAALQRQRKRASLSENALDRKRPAHSARKVAADGETQPNALVRPV